MSRGTIMWQKKNWLWYFNRKGILDFTIFDMEDWTYRVRVMSWYFIPELDNWKIPLDVDLSLNYDCDYDLRYQDLDSAKQAVADFILNLLQIF